MRDLDRPIGSALPAFLCEKRWFGAKGRTIARAAVEDTVDLDGDARTVLAIVAIAYEDAPPDRYALLLATRPDPGALPVVVRLEDGESVVDASSEPASIARLLAVFVAGPRPSRAGGWLECRDVTEHARRALCGAMPPVASLGAEQSNTSLRVGHDFIFKLIRRLQAGEHPEVEVGRFLLTRTAFRACPSLAGSLTYRQASGAAFTVGVLQGWVESRGDGWAWTLDKLAGAQRGANVAAAIQQEMAILGRVTAEFHRALASDEASPAFSPEIVTPADFTAWSDRLRDETTHAIDRVQSIRASWTQEMRSLAAQAITALEQAVPGLIGGAPASASFHKIRIHGDYHLGQTLKTADGFALIDFEGEPAKPLEERRRKTCVLKDVAGMLRSFEYAIESVAAGDVDAAADLRRRAGLRAAFLGSYLDSAASLRAKVVPDRAATLGWLRIFELEKALYELEYEIDNRPMWIRIPLRGILSALRSTA